MSYFSCLVAEYLKTLFSQRLCTSIFTLCVGVSISFYNFLLLPGVDVLPFFHQQYVQPLAPVCKLCQNQKPKDVDDRNRMWSCKLCTLDNSLKSDHCTACGEWRYSHGPPIATPTPNLGTWGEHKLRAMHIFCGNCHSCLWCANSWPNTQEVN